MSVYFSHMEGVISIQFKVVPPPFFNSNAAEALYQWRTEGGGFGVLNPPPKFQSFDKAAFDCKLSGKCLVFLFQHPN